MILGKLFNIVGSISHPTGRNDKSPCPTALGKKDMTSRGPCLLSLVLGLLGALGLALVEAHYGLMCSFPLKGWEAQKERLHWKGTY